jgi:predicted ArsR family transcriptional regulator
MSNLTTRHRILQYLAQHRTSTARQVARAMRVTPANARRHLNILASDGRVEAVDQKQLGRGRPEKIFSLSGTMKGDNLEGLVRAWLEGVPKSRRQAILEEIGRESLAPQEHQPHGNLAGRLSAIMECMNAMHYHVRWEAGNDGPRIILGHCPYKTVITSYPELCQMDAALLEEILGIGVVQTSKLQKKLGGSPVCIFQVKPV